MVLRREALAAAERELRAAEALLLDPRCHGPLEASLHLARGWRALARLQSIDAAGPPASPDDPMGKLDPVDLPPLGAAEHEEWERSMQQLARAESRDPWAMPPPEELPTRSLLVRHCRWLAHALVNARRRLSMTATRQRRWSAKAVGIGSAVTAVAAFTVATFFPAGARPAWRVSYFDNVEMAGTPIRTSSDRLFFEWYRRPPIPSIPADGFSAVFESCLVLEKPERVRFVLGSDDGSRLIVNDRIVIDNWGQHPYQTKEATIELDAGKQSLRVDYFDKIGRARVGVWAAFADGLIEPIPSALLKAPREGEKPCG